MTLNNKEFSISTHGGDAILRRMKAIRRDFWRSHQLRTALNSVKKEALVMAKGKVRKRSRRLMRKIEARIENFGTNHPTLKLGVFDFKNEYGYNYAPYIEYGTKPHIIRPRNKRWLMWMTNSYRGGKKIEKKPGAHFPKGAIIHRAKSVNHPGNKPMPYLGPTIRKMRPRLAGAISKAMRQFINKQR